MDFRARLRERIEFLGLRDKEVAEKAGITKRAIDSYVGARACMPPADVAVRLAQVLGVTVEYLVNGSNPCQSKNPSESKEDIETQIYFYKKYSKLIKNMENLSSKNQRLVNELSGALIAR